MLLFSGFLYTSCIYEEKIPYEDIDIVHIGDRLPYFSVIDNKGDEISNGNLAGKPTFIVFFNTLCPDCRKELPIIQRFYDENKELVKLICISRSESESSVHNYWMKNGFDMPYSAQNDDSVYKLFAMSGVPRIYVTDSDLYIRYIYTDEKLPEYDELLNILRKL